MRQNNNQGQLATSLQHRFHVSTAACLYFRRNPYASTDLKYNPRQSEDKAIFENSMRILREIAQEVEEDMDREAEEDF